MTKAEEQQRKADREEFDALKARIDKLARSIAGGGGSGFTTVAAQQQLAESHRDEAVDDAEIRALRPNESCVDFLSARGRLSEQSRYEGLTLGRYLRSLLVGPRDDVERRALSEGSDAGGGYTVPDVLAAALIDRLRPASHVLAAGARLVPLDSDRHSFAKIEADPTPSWRLENAAVGESEPTFTSISFSPKSVAFVVKASRELLQDSVNLEEQLPTLFVRTMAAEIDRVVLLGDDANDEPIGMRNAAGISELVLGVDDGGPLTDYSTFLAIRRTILEANAPEPNTVIYAPRTGEVVEGLTASDGQPLMRPPALSSWRFRETSKIPIDETQGTSVDASSSFVGNFGLAWIGQRLETSVEVLRERYADNLQVGFLVHARLDVQFEHPAGLGRIIGIVPA